MIFLSIRQMGQGRCEEPGPLEPSGPVEASGPLEPSDPIEPSGPLESSGFSLPEALVALLLLGLVIQAGWTVLATVRKGAEKAQVAAEALETARTVGWILDQDLGGRPLESAWWSDGADSVALRAFRGLALIRSRTEEGVMMVCYSGTRSPAPEKDSLLVLGERGVWFPLDLLRREPGGKGCWGAGRGQEESWVVEGGGEAGDWHLARLFERGSYHMADGAFRYRSGRGGRQPITLRNLEAGSFHTLAWERSGIGWRMALDSLGGGIATWRGTVR